jgi:hypothetical protein
MNHVSSVYSKVISVCFLLVINVMASGRIRHIQVVDGGLELTVETTAAEQYQVQCCTNLVAGSWIDIGPGFMAASTNTVRKMDAEASSCWYRVVIEETAGVEEPTDPDSPPDLPPPPPNG